MKTIKIMKFIVTALIPVFLFGFFSTSIAQEKVEKKEVKFKMIKEVNGERVVIDTTFDAANLENLEDFPVLQQFLRENDMEDLNFDIVDSDNLFDMDVEVIETGEDGYEITKTIMIKSSGDGEVEMDKNYNIMVHTIDSSEHGKIMKVKVDGDSQAYFYSDDEELHEMDIDGEKQMIVVKKKYDGDETTVMVTDGDFSWTEGEDGKNIRIEEGEDGNKKVIIEEEDGSIKEIILDEGKGAYMIDEKGNLKKVSEDAVWVEEGGDMITLEVDVDDDNKTIIIKENGTTIDIKDLDENSNVWVYESDEHSEGDEEVQVFLEMIKKQDGDNTIAIKKKVILKSISENDMENFEKSGVDIEPAEGNKLELEKLVFSPNPSDGKFTLKFNTPDSGKTSINIYDINGKEVYKENIKNLDGPYEKQIDISSKGKGTYFLKIQQAEKFSTQKIILE